MSGWIDEVQRGHALVTDGDVRFVRGGALAGDLLDVIAASRARGRRVRRRELLWLERMRRLQPGDARDLEVALRGWRPR